MSTGGVYCDWCKRYVQVAYMLLEGEHRGPIVGAQQDGEVVCQCLTCGKAWTASGRILQEGRTQCRDEEEP